MKNSMLGDVPAARKVPPQVRPHHLGEAEGPEPEDSGGDPKRLHESVVDCYLSRAVMNAGRSDEFFPGLG